MANVWKGVYGMRLNIKESKGYTNVFVVAEGLLGDFTNLRGKLDDKFQILDGKKIFGGRKYPERD